MWLRNNGWRLMSDQFMTDRETTMSNKALGGMMYIAEYTWFVTAQLSDERHCWRNWGEFLELKEHAWL